MIKTITKLIENMIVRWKVGKHIKKLKKSIINAIKDGTIETYDPFGHIIPNGYDIKLKLNIKAYDKRIQEEIIRLKSMGLKPEDYGITKNTSGNTLNYDESHYYITRFNDKKDGICHVISIDHITGKRRTVIIDSKELRTLYIIDDKLKSILGDR